jgi:hypothetical protein
VIPEFRVKPEPWQPGVRAMGRALPWLMMLQVLLHANDPIDIPMPGTEDWPDVL